MNIAAIVTCNKKEVPKAVPNFVEKHLLNLLHSI